MTFSLKPQQVHWLAKLFTAPKIVATRYYDIPKSLKKASGMITPSQVEDLYKLGGKKSEREALRQFLAANINTTPSRNWFNMPRHYSATAPLYIYSDKRVFAPLRTYNTVAGTFVGLTLSTVALLDPQGLKELLSDQDTPKNPDGSSK
jgi:hypothetical protein